MKIKCKCGKTYDTNDKYYCDCGLQKWEGKFYRLPAGHIMEEYDYWKHSTYENFRSLFKKLCIKCHKTRNCKIKEYIQACMSENCPPFPKDIVGVYNRLSYPGDGNFRQLYCLKFENAQLVMEGIS